MTPPARVWPEDEPGLPPLEGIVAAQHQGEIFGWDGIGNPFILTQFVGFVVFIVDVLLVQHVPRRVPSTVVPLPLSRCSEKPPNCGSFTPSSSMFLMS